MTFARSFFLFSFLVSAAGLTACGDDDDNDNDGGGGNYVGLLGSARDVHATAQGETVVAFDEKRWSSVSAWSSASGAPVAYPGTADAGGELRFPDVPTGPYLLELVGQLPSNPALVPSRTFFELNNRTVDLGRFFSHRPDVQTMASPTSLTINAALTRPWQADVVDAAGGVPVTLGDVLNVYSRNAYVLGIASTDVTPVSEGGVVTSAPRNGAAALAWTLDAQEVFSTYTGPSGAHLIDASKGDDFALLHEVSRPVRTPGVPPAGGGTDPWQAYAYTSLESILQATPFTMTDGGSSTIEGTFVAAPPQTFAFDYKGSAFNDLLRDAPSADRTRASLTFSLYHEPAFPETAIGGFADLLTVNLNVTNEFVDPVCNSNSPELCEDLTTCPAGCNDAQVLVLPGDHAQAYTYGNPFPPAQEVASFFYSSSARARAGAAEDAFFSVRFSFSAQAPASEMNGQPLAPALSLPRNVTINGLPAPFTQLNTGVGATPVIAFEPPTLGTPTSYLVRVNEIVEVVNEGFSFFRLNQRTASFYGTSTTVTLPEGVLRPGKLYYLEVSAIADEPALSPSLLRRGSHSLSATTVTGVITP